MSDQLKNLKPITAMEVSDKFNIMINKRLKACGCDY